MWARLQRNKLLYYYYYFQTSDSVSSARTVLVKFRTICELGQLFHETNEKYAKKFKVFTENLNFLLIEVGFVLCKPIPTHSTQNPVPFKVFHLYNFVSNCRIGTSDFDAQMSGIKIQKAKEILRPFQFIKSTH